ncbi:YjbH domain-containing protein [Phaeobacter inhibens]|uniref:YjbH domain-containing protein n=1 Tax=Phaeobacter inhibens TaxID=221822 RepID=UPI0021A4FC1F|nr:YjbH domain-containing protein [Phaeobacter inhibens]UWR98159.1 YjbH domain-containing protein [Phaeobacter inhibens]
MRVHAILLIGCLSTLSGPLGAIRAPAQTLSTYGTPGLVDMPTAEVLPDGTLALTTSNFDNTSRNTLTFQMLPNVYGSFRYSFLRDFDPGVGLSRYDRSFDVHFQLRRETAAGPAIALGLRDFGGTGVYAGEYLVATKHVTPDVTVTGGIGWGRLAGRGGQRNPLTALNGRFDTREDSNAGGISTTGQLDFGNWFRGDAALFGGLRWNVTPHWSVMAEYSSDTYSAEAQRGLSDVRAPFNIGASYRFDNGVTLGGSYLNGSALAVQLSYAFDPRRAAAPGGQGAAAPALKPAEQVALASWNLAQGRTNGSQSPRLNDVLKSQLEAEGLRLINFEREGASARITVENLRYGAAAQAVGRTTRVMANTLPPHLQQFEVTLAENGLPTTRIKSQRSDLYELEGDLDEAWRSLARTEIEDAPERIAVDQEIAAFPRFTYRFGPYTQLSFFDPDEPLRYEIGAELKATYQPAPGWTFAGQLRQPVIGNLDSSARPSNSVLPRVRSDWARYASESDLRLSHLTADYSWRPGQDLFARVTAGYLEQMFGGISAELLWFPVGSSLALGAELNYARQRDFDVQFGFQDYDVMTGHASVYYKTRGDYHVQVDMGRYLAGDWGTTVTVDREFNNGFKVGAFATLTDASYEEFGEGSFDKGIRVEVPVAWLTGKPSRRSITQVIRPVLRDGGARLNVQTRLYDKVRDSRGRALAAQWGRYAR